VRTSAAYTTRGRSTPTTTGTRSPRQPKPRAGHHEPRAGTARRTQIQTNRERSRTPTSLSSPLTHKLRIRSVESRDKRRTKSSRCRRRLCPRRSTRRSATSTATSSPRHSKPPRARPPDRLHRRVRADRRRRARYYEPGTPPNRHRAENVRQPPGQDALPRARARARPPRPPGRTIQTSTTPAKSSSPNPPFSAVVKRDRRNLLAWVWVTVSPRRVAEVGARLARQRVALSSSVAARRAAIARGARRRVVSGGVVGPARSAAMMVATEPWGAASAPTARPIVAA
jgi:hypothetical protein